MPKTSPPPQKLPTEPQQIYEKTKEAFEETMKFSKKLKKNVGIRNAAKQEIIEESHPKLEKDFVRLPQTPTFEEIYFYFDKYKKILKEPHYLIILSRLAHLKNAKEYKLDHRLHEILRKVCNLNLKTSPKYVANFIKYCAMIGIHDKIIWRKLISELYKTDFQRNLTEFCLTLNYLQIHGILSKSLLNFMQDKAIEIIETNPDNQSFRIMELLLNSLKNFKILPELLTVILKRLHLHIHIMPLKNLRNCFIPSVQMKLEDDELWNLYRKWLFLRMDVAKTEEFEAVKENYSYLLFTFAKMVDENLFNMREKFLNEDYKQIKVLFYEIFEQNKEKLFVDNNPAHFLRIFKAFTLFSANYAESEDVKIMDFLIVYMIKCKDLNEKLRIIDFYEIFLCILRINVLCRPFSKHKTLLNLLTETLIPKSLDLPIIYFKKISDFFIEEKKSLLKNGEISNEELMNVFEKLKEMLGTIIRVRAIKKDEDVVTMETVLENFKKGRLIEEENYNALKQQIKRNFS